MKWASVIPERYYNRDSADTAIKQVDIPACLISESLRTTILVQQVMVISILNGIQRRIRIAELLVGHIVLRVKNGLPANCTV